MDRIFGDYLRAGLMASAAIVCVATATPAMAQTRTFNVPAQSAASGISTFARQADIQLLISARDARGRRTAAVRGALTVEQGLEQLLAGSGLRAERTGTQTYSVVPEMGEAGAGSAAADNGSAGGEEVVVTGSRIRNIEAIASPLTTYSREAIQQTARTDVSDFLQSIPQNFSGGSFGLTPDGVLGGGAQRFLNTTGAVSPNLRGLGPGSTLTLVNGHRVATAAGSAFVDIGAIPLSAIERVDVIADGASAVYGGEAVGGVVNFILRRNLEGAESNLSYEFADAGDYTNLTASQSFGTSWNGGSLLVSGAYRDRGELNASDRSFARKLGVFNFGGLVLDPQLYPDQQEYSGLIVVRQQLGDDIEGSIDAWYSRRDQTQVAGGGTTFTLFEPRSDQFSVHGSLDVALFDGLRANFHGGYSTSREDVSQEDYRPGIGRIFFSAGAQDFDLWYANANVNGDLVHLPGGNLSFAIGAEHRQEDFTFDLDSTFGPAFRQGSREVSSAYGELLIPVVGEENASPLLNRVSVSLAGRYDHYSDVGDAWTGKAGLVVDILSGIRLRGTYSTAFRAPTVDDITRSGITDLLSNVVTFLSPTGPGRARVINLRGRGDLMPERAKILTAGLEVRPRALPGLFASATYFDYDYRDRLASPPFAADTLLRPAVFGDIFQPVTSAAQVQALIDAAAASGGLVRLETPPLPLSSYEFIIDGRFRNLAVQRVRGFDFELRYGFEIDGVRLDAQGAATYVLKDERQISPSSLPDDFVGLFGEQPRLKLRSQISARSGGLTATGAVTHLSSFRNTNVLNRPRTDAFTTVDLNLQYRFDNGLAGGMTTLGLAVRNLFDTSPPFVQRPVTAPDYDPANANPLGRVFLVRVLQNW